jgi:hypothetical protein
VGWGFAGMGIVLLLACIIYLSQPMWYSRSRQLILLDHVDDPVFVERVRFLASAARTPHVRFLISPSIRRQDARAFGFPWRPYVKLDSGLRLVLRKNLDLFDAKVNHELAHVINGDLFYAYALRALFWSFLAVAAIYNIWRFVPTGENFVRQWWPWLVAGGSPLRALLDHVGPLGGATLFLPVVFVLTLEYARLLRLREHFADWRTADIVGKSGLLNVLRYPAAAHRRWHRVALTFVRFHPMPEERAAALRNPARFLSIHFGDIFLVGLQLSFLLDAAADLGADLDGGSSIPLFSRVGVPSYLVFMFITVLWIYAVSGIVVRASIVKAAGGRSYLSAPGCILGLTIGFTVASLLWPSSPFYWLDVAHGGVELAELIRLVIPVIASASFVLAALLIRPVASIMERRWYKRRSPIGYLILLRILFVYWFAQGMQLGVAVIILIIGLDDPLECNTSESVVCDFIGGVDTPTLAWFTILSSFVWVVLSWGVAFLLIQLFTRHGSPDVEHGAVRWPYRAAAESSGPITRASTGSCSRSPARPISSTPSST